MSRDDVNIGNSGRSGGAGGVSRIGLGTLLSGARIVSDAMLNAAATKLAAMMSEEELAKGIIFPPTDRYSIYQLTLELTFELTFELTLELTYELTLELTYELTLELTLE